jgi:nucleoid-associated protein YgaU
MTAKKSRFGLSGITARLGDYNGRRKEEFFQEDWRCSQQSRRKRSSCQSRRRCSRQTAAEAKAKVEAEAAKLKAEAETKKQDLLEAQERYAREAEARKAEFEARKAAEEEAKKTQSWPPTLSVRRKPSHIALKHYGHATPPYYKLIYEFNKDVIGDNINIIVPGQELRIPVLPEELK